jgi:putative flippase GtrA
VTPQIAASTPVVVIPALEPDHHLVDLVNDLIAADQQRLLIIDDGSGPDFQPLFDQLETLGCTVLRHPVNRGKGAALKNALAYAAERWPEAVGYVTADSDGQHSATDIGRVAQALLDQPQALVLGVRDFSGADVPRKNRTGNRLTSLVFRLESGVTCVDTQTGLRGLSAQQLELFLAVPGDRFEYEMNVLMALAEAKVPFVALPITTIYRDDNSHSHFRPVRDSFRIYYNIVKFGLSSLLGAAVDLAAFLILVPLLAAWPQSVAAATVIARLLSGVVNYTVNKRLVFGDRRRSTHSAPQYALLFASAMVISAVTTQVLSHLPIPLIVSKIVVDSTLFVINYYVQRHFIFRRSSQTQAASANSPVDWSPKKPDQSAVSHHRGRPTSDQSGR